MTTEAPETPITDEPTPPQANGNDGPAPNDPALSYSVADLFKFSGYVHVGPGAEKCEHGEDGKCNDHQHFHAWCRLPNKFQQSQIREKALAAKARTVRRLKDPESDGHVILESQLDAMRESGEGDKETLVGELMQTSYAKAHFEAMQELMTEEDSPFSSIEEDERRWLELKRMNDEERPQDEYEELTRHLEAWNERVDELREEKLDPEKEALMGKSVAELVDMIRQERIDSESSQSFQRSYSYWMWFLGTMEPRDPAKGLPSERRWKDYNQMTSAAPEIIEALEQQYVTLEKAWAAARQESVRAEGNS